MKQFFPLMLAACLLVPDAGRAGAWLREKGSGFTALSFGVTHAKETTNAFYFEYGLSDQTTIGLDISAFTNARNVRNGFGNLFVRRSLGPTEGPHRFAYELGVGGLWGNERQLPVLKTGLSWGYGFTRVSGWVNLDLGYVHEPQLGESIAKIDGTLGLDFGSITTGLLEFTLSKRGEDTYGAVQPSLLIKPRGQAFNVKLGAEIPYNETERAAVKIGVWHRF